MIHLYSVEFIRERKLQHRSYAKKADALQHAKRALGAEVPVATVWRYTYNGTLGEALAASIDKPNGWWHEASVVRVIVYRMKREKTNGEA